MKKFLLASVSLLAVPFFVFAETPALAELQAQISSLLVTIPLNNEMQKSR